MAVSTQTRTYTVILEPDPEAGGYTVLVPALPDCVTEGGTLEEALANAREAIALTLEDRAARGEPIPDNLTDIHIEQISVSTTS